MRFPDVLSNTRGTGTFLATDFVDMQTRDELLARMRMQGMKLVLYCTILCDHFLTFRIQRWRLRVKIYPIPTSIDIH